jgi:hypothetical protein
MFTFGFMATSTIGTLDWRQGVYHVVSRIPFEIKVYEVDVAIFRSVISQSRATYTHLAQKIDISSDPRACDVLMEEKTIL